MSTRSLEDLLLAARDLDKLDLRARLQWLEDAATAAEALDLGDEGKQGALHLRAALGAVIKWGHAQKAGGTSAPAKEDVAQLEALLRTLIARGTVGLYRALAAAWDELARERPPHRTACIEVRDAFREAARAVETGAPVPQSVREKLEGARASVEHA